MYDLATVCRLRLTCNIHRTHSAHGGAYASIKAVASGLVNLAL